MSSENDAKSTNESAVDDNLGSDGDNDVDNESSDDENDAKEEDGDEDTDNEAYDIDDRSISEGKLKQDKQEKKKLNKKAGFEIAPSMLFN